ncbi:MULTISPECIES: sensor histidine kinase [Burkholderia]|uniref:sensor histidine kinase n=1 Tax=Burkholderia TaxID=32008 RepID=UPI00075B8611|nr:MULTISPECIES: sensor histidine kinase [Burkholderia]AOJ73521.1 histidine kinase [Burkholderia savannae]KVG38938.1 histidine kinase [Burkholderia sp. MSMB0265]KVG81663.1 histidine kinase [Burkholderia sp. MSMB2040]KVG98822.1 histidine kinase [Burkholderia sp. MSMB2042]KVG99001.1 histidine kinase [Burkholderia sp. MSMB2041]
MLIVQTCVYLVIAYLFTRTRLFLPFMHVSMRLPHRIACYVVFSLFCIMGTYLGFDIDNSIANTRAIGAVLGGTLGGPIVGFAVGLTGGLHRYTIGGPTAFACMVSTVAEGLIGGLYHLWMIRRGRLKRLLQPIGVALVTFVAELVQMAILLVMVKPGSLAHQLVGHIAVPMLLANTLGAGMFVSILLDRRQALERQSSLFSARALKIAARAEGALRGGLDTANATRVARIVYEETGVGAVTITDRDKVLAFIGIGDDHHLTGTPITSLQTIEAIERNVVVYADGNELAYQCPICPTTCPLGAALVIPLLGEEERVIGTIILAEPKTKLFSTINRTLGEGIARLLSAQILAGRYEDQKQMLTQSELKLLQAQINPHFLFNTLNTLAAVIAKDPERARQLVQNLSTFFRKNLKRPSEEVPLEDELEHVEAYLEIEKARFAGKLDVQIDIPPEFSGVRLPAFSIQPIVENAIKHGTSQLIGKGAVFIAARRDGDDLLIEVTDNAGLYDEHLPCGGLGMNLVDKRLRNSFGPGYGTTVMCEDDVWTRVTLRIPMESTTL